jgi:hypothetical protein
MTTISKKVSKVEEKISHTFPDGTAFTGSFEQLQKVSAALGMKITGISVCPRGYYPSESKGVVKISTMNDYHIRRALLKRTKDYFTRIFEKEDDNREFLNKYTQLLNDPVVEDLLNELAERIVPEHIERHADFVFRR